MSDTPSKAPSGEQEKKGFVSEALKGLGLDNKLNDILPNANDFFEQLVNMFPKDWQAPIRELGKLFGFNKEDKEKREAEGTLTLPESFNRDTILELRTKIIEGAKAGGAEWTTTLESLSRLNSMDPGRLGVLFVYEGDGSSAVQSLVDKGESVFITHSSTLPKDMAVTIQFPKEAQSELNGRYTIGELIAYDTITTVTVNGTEYTRGTDGAYRAGETLAPKLNHGDVVKVVAVKETEEGDDNESTENAQTALMEKRVAHWEKHVPALAAVFPTVELYKGTIVTIMQLEGVDAQAKEQLIEILPALVTVQEGDTPVPINIRLGNIIDALKKGTSLEDALKEAEIPYDTKKYETAIGALLAESKKHLPE